MKKIVGSQKAICNSNSENLKKKKQKQKEGNDY